MNVTAVVAVGFLGLAMMGLIGCAQSNPPAPKPTVSENISWAIGETKVTATITRPDTSGLHPGIVFVAGSGPTDKDWNSPLLPGTNGSAMLLSEELARRGFVTIRYDKRVTGPEAQRNMPLLIGKISMQSHLEEMSGAVDQLLARSDVDPTRIYAVANSEGTIHAMNYQLEKEPKFAGLVLLAPPGRSMTEIIHSQIEAQVTSLPNSKEIMAAFDTRMADFLAEKPFAADPSLPEGINNLLQSLDTPVNLPFARELFMTVPSSLLSQVTSPVIAVIGKKDIQVDWQADGQVLETAAAGHKNITFNYPENANHVLKNETRPRSSLTGADGLTYNTPERVLDQDALNTVVNWLAEQTSAR